MSVPTRTSTNEITSNEFDGHYADYVTVTCRVTTGVDDHPTARRLAITSHPNPFNPMTTIRFSLGASAVTRLLIYDVAGHLVRRLADEPLLAGDHEVVWRGIDDQGRPVQADMYFARLERW